MKMMIDLGNQRGHPLHINTMDIAMATSIDCGREVRFRRSIWSLVECMVPCFGFPPSVPVSGNDTDSLNTPTSPSTSTITGTFFGYKKGRVSFCLHDDTRGSPILLLELGVPTAYLAREMQHGLMRIALECEKSKERPSSSSSCWLYEVPVWSMYCNGRKVGFAVKRRVSGGDAAVLKTMESMSVGAGVLPVGGKCEEELMYMRASFQRVIGSPHSHSFHMINPLGSTAQELSIFLFRS
ncbi:protein MIZU-KUSSEI 1-like [Hibiscus syriacus]|uniref:protein MIZU-KUSSEI 1-like n=1 Tax=Hibiscus syriacus TaxID=106335 RepID=UPI0019217F60|nr:protein MIZU-KUSSEI 1-like [Hibiscus syriacus]